jgi:hypothetical protein
MKLVVSLLLLGALAFAALFVPLAGENGWHRAHREGWLRATGHTAAAAASEGFAWAARVAHGLSERAQASQKTPPPTAPGRKRAMARAPAPQSPAVGPASQPSPGAWAAHGASPASRPHAPVAGAGADGLAAMPAPPPAAGVQRDRIVAAPTKEQLDGDDRKALDKLIHAHGGR